MSLRRQTDGGRSWKGRPEAWRGATEESAPSPRGGCSPELRMEAAIPV
jgi:hypothetical protein